MNVNHIHSIFCQIAQCVKPAREFDEKEKKSVCSLVVVMCTVRLRLVGLPLRARTERSADCSATFIQYCFRVRTFIEEIGNMELAS